MTHPTDEELENRNRKASAAMRGMHKTACYEQGDHPDECDSYFSLAADALDAIAALRAQLAEARTELVRRVDMHECAMAERDDATLYSDEQKARADRAEAALAAQVTVQPPCSHINRDAQGVCWDCGYDARAQLSASPPADPVTNAGCRQKLDGIAGPWFAASAAWHRRAIPAVRVGVTPEEAALEEQIEKLRNLCDCDCDDEDCVKCAHYPAILEQKKDELARILAALEPARHVNETPKSEHGSADVLAALPDHVTLAEALLVPEEQFTDHIEVALDPVGAWNLITALRAALAASQRAIEEGESNG